MEWDFIFTSGIFNFLFYMTIAVLIFGLIAWRIWAWIKKNKVYVFRFHVITPSGNLQENWARIKIDMNQIKKFQLEKYPSQLLDLAEPNCMVNQKPSRVCAWDGSGNLTYVKDIDYDFLNENHKFKVAKLEYLETALKPVERQSMAMNIRDNYNKYGSMPSEFKWFMGGALILCIIVVIGLLAMGKMLGGEVSNILKIADQNAKTSKELRSFNELWQENLNIQMAILKYVTKDNRSINLTTTT